MSGQDYSGFNQSSDAEVFFKGSTDLDNGLTIGVDVQLEGNTSGDTDRRILHVDQRQLRKIHPGFREHRLSISDAVRSV